MIKCYTSAASIKANLKELLKIKDAATKLKTNQEAIVSTSQSSGRRVKRQKNSESVTCATYNVQVSTLTVVSMNIFFVFVQIISITILLGSSKFKSYWTRFYHCYSDYNHLKGDSPSLQLIRNSGNSSKHCNSHNCDCNCRFINHPIPSCK